RARLAPLTTNQRGPRRFAYDDVECVQRLGAAQLDPGVWPARASDRPDRAREPDPRRNRSHEVALRTRTGFRTAGWGVSSRFYGVLQGSARFYGVPFYGVPFYGVPFYGVPFYGVPFCGVPFYGVPFCGVPFCGVPF